EEVEEIACKRAAVSPAVNSAGRGTDRIHLDIVGGRPARVEHAVLPDNVLLENRFVTAIALNECPARGDGVGHQEPVKQRVALRGEHGPGVNRADHGRGGCEWGSDGGGPKGRSGGSIGADKNRTTDP